MDTAHKQMNTFLLLDSFTKEGRRLYESFRNEGFEGPVLVINDEGFLPDDVISVYRFFCGDYKDQPGVKGRPRYFNQIDVPEYWEISATGTMGEIHDKERLRGRIYYSEPAHKRLVKNVDWLDEKGVSRLCEHYDCYGALYAKTILDNTGRRFCKTYMDVNGREVILENFSTGDIILNYNDSTFVYKSKTALAVKAIEELGLTYSKMIFNSLSFPFFVSNSLPDNGKKDILIWQEGIRTDVPGNMKFIFDGNAARASEVYVQNKRACEKLIEGGAPSQHTHPLGYVYSFVRKNTNGKDVLICTNSDNIEKLGEIVRALPEMHFHVAAVTEMSQKLLNMGKNDNVSLYPGISMAMADELFESCDYYLDINHGGEILNAVERAFICDQLILGFEMTLHNRMYIDESHIYNNEADLISEIKRVTENRDALDLGLKMQRESAMAEGQGIYSKLWM